MWRRYAQLMLLVLWTGSASAVNVFTVNSNADPGTGTCDAAECTLREAITLANATANVGGPDEIRFNIPGSGPHRIALVSNLPLASTVMAIQGYTQPGAVANTANAASNAVIRIVIDAAAAGTVNPALQISGVGSDVSGLAVINKASGPGISIAVAASVRGCWLGVDADGTTLAPNQFGVQIVNTSGMATLGGPNLADRNVISASTSHAVQMASITQVRIENNLIGLKPDGLTPGAITTGVFSSLATANQQLVNNTISCASSAVIANFGTLISGNRFGTTADGSAAPGCTTLGFNSGGVAATLSDNLVAYTSTRSINVATSVSGIVFSGNRFIDNATVPIDLLGTTGHTSNDPGDGDTGANNQQNYPVLTDVQRVDANTATVSGTLNSLSGTSFRLEFFASTRLDDGSININADFGDAERVGTSTLDVTTDASGNASFGPQTVTFSGSGYIAGVAATATRLTASVPVETSEIGPLRAAYSPGIADFVVTHTGNGGAGSFKQAFAEADAHPDVGTTRDRISFAIAGSGPHTISVAGLSTLQSNGRLEIDGSTQAGYAANTATVGTNAQLPIDINGVKLALNSSPDTVVRGVVLRGPSALLSLGPGLVESSFIGVSQDGNTLSSTIGNTAQINCGGCRIGGSTLASRNLIGADSNFALLGVNITASGTTVEGNLIGVRRDGVTRLVTPPAPSSTNVSVGISVGFAASSGVQIRNNTVGGFADGVRVETSNALIESNRIGVGDDGLTAAPNSGAGINVRFGGSRLVRNLIANNGDGILIGGPANTCSLIENTLRNNGELGIDLDLTGLFNGDGVSANDNLDPDIGGNNGQNHPLLSAATRTGTEVSANVALNSLPNTSFRVRYCLVNAADPSGRGECDVPVLTIAQVITTDANGNASAVSPALPYTAGATGVTATAARIVGGLEETSEFAPVASLRVLTQTQIVSVAPATAAVGQSFQVTASVASADPALTAGGTVNVSLPGSGSCVITLSAGTGSCTLTAQTAGTGSLTAAYQGNATFVDSIISSNYTITPATSSTLITSDTPDPSTFGDAITVSVAVSSPGGTPSGNVSVSDGNGATCVASLSAGAGNCTLTPAQGGALVLSALYGGSNNFQSSSDSESHQVNPVASSLSILADTPDPSVYGQAVNVSAALGSATGTPAGPIIVSDGAGASCEISGNTGACNLVPVNAGSVTLRADFSGNATYLPSSASATHQTERAGTTLTVSTPFPTAFPDQLPRQFAPTRIPVTLTVQAPGSGAPSGTVSVQNTAGIETCVIVLPATHCDLTPQTVGTLNLQLDYTGDSRFLPAAQTLEFTVLPDRLFRDGVED